MAQGGQVFTVTLEANRAKRVLGDNAERASFSFKNLGSTAAYYGFNSNVATSGKDKGWEISASGGSINNIVWEGEVWIISTAAVEITVEELNGAQRVKVIV